MLKEWPVTFVLLHQLFFVFRSTNLPNILFPAATKKCHKQRRQSEQSVLLTVTQSLKVFPPGSLLKMTQMTNLQIKEWNLCVPLPVSGFSSGDSLVKKDKFSEGTPSDQPTASTTNVMVKE